ncbi:MAG: ATP synthase F1 subunit delta [Polyangia bacterium]
MVSGSIARRWAKALFLLGEENRNLVGLVREVERAAEAWSASEELRDTLGNPLLAESTRREVWDKIVRRLGVSRHCKSFLSLLFDKSRFSALPAISRELRRLSDSKDGRLRAEIVGAEDVPRDVANRVRAALQRGTGKAVVITTRSDPELIGGLVTRVGDLMYDGSIRTRLVRIREEIVGRV